MGRYEFAIIRLFPRPSTGEFLNLGYLAWTRSGEFSLSKSSRAHLMHLNTSHVQRVAAVNYLDCLPRRIRDEASHENLTAWVDRERGDQQSMIQWSANRGGSFESLDQACEALDAQILTKGGDHA